MKRTTIGLAMLALLVHVCFAEELVPSNKTLASPFPAAKSIVADKERSPFSDISFLRMEAIAVGSFPISLFYVSFGLDLASYFIKGFDAQYAPWPFKSSQALTILDPDTDKIVRLSSAVALSLAVAILDAVILPGALARRSVGKGSGYFPVPPSGFDSGGPKAAPSKDLPSESSSFPQPESEPVPVQGAEQGT
ncbi:MAG: hypothetical protein WCL50_06800 [Spirochaetota bacterium]